MLTKLLQTIGYLILTICLGLTIRYFFLNGEVKSNANTASTQAVFAATFPDENNKPQALKQWQGKIVVLNFWATWCPPCREEMPELSALNSQYQDKNVVVLGVAIDEVSLIKQFTSETKISYPLFAAENNGMELAASLGNDKGVLPYTVIIKPDGSIAKTYFGRISKPLLEETLIKLM
jgi:thiol-disulfide isomerase/thioredoxin